MSEEKQLKDREFKVILNFKLRSETVEIGIEKVKAAMKFMGLDVVSVKCISGLRSDAQNNALHLWFDQIEDEAAKKGLTIDLLIKNPTEVPITAEILKDLFRLMGKRLYKKDSTAKLEKMELSEIVKYFDKAILERLGINIPFPNLDLLIDRDNNLEQNNGQI